MRQALHPLVQQLLPEARKRRERAHAEREFDGDVQRLEKAWPFEPLPDRACSAVDCLGLPLELDAIVAFADGDVRGFASAFRNASAFRCLAFRWHVFIGTARPEGTIPISAWETVRVAGPAILGLWQPARVVAEALVLAAHADMARTVEEVRAKYWGKGTVDALLIGLLSQAFDIPTHYRPVNPIVEPYRVLLEHWPTSDEALFRKTMHAAAEFHLACSGDGDGDVRYEFEWFFNQIFPLELLVVQALRRRDGLPAFDTGHSLIDATWALLCELPEAPPQVLLARIEQRLRKDYPAFR